MKRILYSIALLVWAVAVAAVPAKRAKQTITLKDGQRIEVCRMGDELKHFLQAENGQVAVKTPQGYELMDADAIMAEWQQKISLRNEIRRKRAARKSKRMAQWGATSNPVSGSKKGLVILVNYKDLGMTYSQSVFNDVFNKENYRGNGMAGSVHDYFYSQSYGQFDLTFDVVGPVTVSREMSYYGKNDDKGDDMYAAEMVAEACRLADKLVDFSVYDWDDDGEVDQVYVIYAGYGEAQDNSVGGKNANTIWPHEFELSSAAALGDGPGALILDGVRVDTYACSCELGGYSGADIDGIGTACHEFSHCMCVPDMYDLNGRNFGMDAWDLMDYGCYNDDGYAPAGYTAYERMYCGWLTPTELLDPCFIADMPALEEEPVAYCIRNSGWSNEYYLLENHQKVGWGKGAAGHGLLVVHVDFDRQAWIDNTVNTGSIQRMTIIPADGKSTHGSLSGDPYPGTSQNTMLTDDSAPAASLHRPNALGRFYMGHSITDITEVDGRVGFSYDAEYFVPYALAATNISADGFTANWEEVEGADEYEIRLISRESSVNPKERLLLEEDFSLFKKDKESSTSITGMENNFTHTPGWTASKVYYTTTAEAKLGNTASPGFMRTPALFPREDKVSLVLSIRRYSADDNGSVEISVDGKVLQTLKPQPEVKRHYITLEASEGMKITVATSTRRAYLGYLAVYDGDCTDVLFEEDQLAGGQENVSSVRTFSTTQTSFVFDGLDPASTYVYRVRSRIGSHWSEWSEAVYVALGNAVEEISSAAQGSAPFYDLMGRKVANPRAGVYVRNEKKILIK